MCFSAAFVILWVETQIRVAKIFCVGHETAIFMMIL
jgi:hypothetical protein